MKIWALTALRSCVACLPLLFYDERRRKLLIARDRLGKKAAALRAGRPAAAFRIGDQVDFGGCTGTRESQQRSPFAIHVFWLCSRSAHGLFSDSKTSSWAPSRIRRGTVASSAVLGFAAIQHTSAAQRRRVSGGAGAALGGGSAYSPDFRRASGGLAEWRNRFLHGRGLDGAGELQTGENIFDRLQSRRF